MKIHHIAIICSDYAVSKKFYTEILDLNIIREVYREERQSYKLDLAINGIYQIELFSFPEPSARPSRPEAAGLRHLAFEVDDVTEVAKILNTKEQSFRIIFQFKTGLIPFFACLFFKNNGRRYR